MLTVRGESDPGERMVCVGQGTARKQSRQNENTNRVFEELPKHQLLLNTKHQYLRLTGKERGKVSLCSTVPSNSAAPLILDHSSWALGRGELTESSAVC